jgi:hypothetical protein
MNGASVWPWRSSGLLSEDERMLDQMEDVEPIFIVCEGRHDEHYFPHSGISRTARTGFSRQIQKAMKCSNHSTVCSYALASYS